MCASKTSALPTTKSCRCCTISTCTRGPARRSRSSAHTGAGKSTLVNLLTRFYEFDGGEILIDGQPLRDFSKSALRSAIGMVTQESFLFNGTIRDNLRLGKPEATDEELWDALDAANARELCRAACRRASTRSSASAA